jgi:hypothetical protein
MLRYYVLDGHTPKMISPDEWMARAQSDQELMPHVAKTDIYPRGPGDGRIHVSTVFLASDHGWGMGPPLLFETMIFPDAGWDMPLPNGETGALSDFQERYTTWDAAQAGHKAAVALVHLALDQKGVGV